MIKIEIVSKENNLPQVPDALEQGIKVALENIGQQLVEAIKAKIMSNVPPPLAEATARRKGSDQTLIDTGAMLNQVSSEVVSDTEVNVGVIGDRAEVAMYQEFGTRTIPERSFIRSSLEENTGEIDNTAKEGINSELRKVIIE